MNPRPGQRPRLNKRRKQSTAQNRLAKAVAKGATDGPVKVQLDHRTVITLANDKALAFWRIRYPDLRVIK